MYRDDLVRLRHMIDAAQEAIGFSAGRYRKDLDQDRMLVLSLVKSVEIMGEAAAKVSESFRLKYPELPWREMVAMRNRLIHGYFDINLDGVAKSPLYGVTAFFQGLGIPDVCLCP